jgi:ribokinase
MVQNFKKSQFQVGKDFFGDYNLENLNKGGVETKYIQKSTTAMTSTAAITVSEDGENSIVVTLGANLELSPARAQELQDVISKAGLVLCQCEIPQDANLEAFKIARQHGGRLVIKIKWKICFF